MNLSIEKLEELEAPLSNDYWTGFLAVVAIGAGIIVT
ncbi:MULTISPECIES: daptide-type RiPP [unclassified Massilia]|nr:daptide-type RiPP [Massilia sp. ST3]